jgi:hypothetical protein
MNEEKTEKIACHVCQKMIPKAAALHAEGQDYVLYFCDIGCLDYWKSPEKRRREET